jgi:Flp pilus assembly protein TadG
MTVNIATATRRTSRQTGKAACLARDRRGVTAIEFGFAAVPLFALMIASLQVTLAFFAQQNLETASGAAVRKLMTGSVQNAGMTQAQFKALVCTKLPAFMKCANLMVDVRVATSFSAANTAPPTITFDSSGNPTNSWSYAPGGPGQITIAKVMYIWDVQKGPLGFDISTMSSSKRLLIATSVFKTEKFA